LVHVKNTAYRGSEAGQLRTSHLHVPNKGVVIIAPPHPGRLDPLPLGGPTFPQP
jgi:1-acyl-sn-glycerol-3-phosphate acyltransferase